MALTTDPRLIGGRRPGPDRKLSPDKELDAVKDYCSGMKLRAIEIAHGITKPTLYEILKRHGIARMRTTNEMDSGPHETPSP